MDMFAKCSEWLETHKLTTMIAQIHRILEHPCPQNASVGNIENNGKIRVSLQNTLEWREPAGLLNLTRKDHNCPPTITKEAVCKVIHDCVQEAITKQREKLNTQNTLQNLPTAERKEQEDMSSEDVTIRLTGVSLAFPTAFNTVIPESAMPHNTLSFVPSIASNVSPNREMPENEPNRDRTGAGFCPTNTPK
jgi:hypothetical protein